MFTLQQMHAAHARVKTGADFPAYVQEIKALGLQYYDFMVQDGRTVYSGADGFQLSGTPVYEEKAIAATGAAEMLRRIITEHQQGKTDFATFCTQVAAAGVEKWVVDTRSMLCSYYDKAGNVLVAEPIPDGTY